MASNLADSKYLTCKFCRSDSEVAGVAQLRLVFVATDAEGEEAHLAYVRWLKDSPKASERKFSVRRMVWGKQTARGGHQVPEFSVIDIDDILTPACVQHLPQQPDIFYFNEFV